MQLSTPPVIIIGMHRSGTSMIANTLGRLGLFMGADLEKNNESKFFIRLNAWLLRECGAKWDRPIPVSMLLNDSNLAKLTIDYLSYQLQKLPISQYSGLRRFVACDLPFSPHSPWGWKDPRNTYTLPVWLQIFPNAKVLHVYRNGIDIASSLKVRAENDLVSLGKRHELLKKISFYRFSKKHRGFTGSPTVLDIHNGFSLWEHYIETAFSYERELGVRMHHVRYEDFLENPIEQMATISNFCGLSATVDEINRSVRDIRQSRSFAFQKDPVLMEFYREVKNSGWMQKLGYGTL